MAAPGGGAGSARPPAGRWAGHLRNGARTGGSGYAIGRRRPKPALLHHCNRDNQYAACEYREKFDQHGLLAPMSRKGGCWDNAAMERFFGSLESEWTNSDRLHSFFDYTTPRKRNWPLLRKRVSVTS